MSTELKLNSEVTSESSTNPERIIDYCFTIEGNIGCGKSTFLAILKEKFP